LDNVPRFIEESQDIDGLEDTKLIYGIIVAEEKAKAEKEDKFI
jgi:hypothetical protein